MINEYNLYTDLATVISTGEGSCSVELVNRRIIHPTVKVVGSKASKVGEDGIVIYVGRFKQPYFIPFSFNNGSGNYQYTNEGTESVKIDFSVDRTNFVNKLDAINFSNYKYIISYRNERDINWANPDWMKVVKSVCDSWEQYCTAGRALNQPHADKIYPILEVGYMSRKDGKLDSTGHVLGTGTNGRGSKGSGHKNGWAIDMNFSNYYEHYDKVDDYTIQAIVKFFDICQQSGVGGIGYNLNPKYQNRLNKIYHFLSDHTNHFHVSAKFADL